MNDDVTIVGLSLVQVTADGDVQQQFSAAET